MVPLAPGGANAAVLPKEQLTFLAKKCYIPSENSFLAAEFAAFNHFEGD